MPPTVDAPVDMDDASTPPLLDPATRTDRMPEWADSPALVAAKAAALEAVNDVRSFTGGEPLRLDAFACRVATGHATAMAEGGFESHFDTQGRSPLRRWASERGEAHVFEIVQTVAIPATGGRTGDRPRLNPEQLTAGVQGLCDQTAAQDASPAFRAITADWPTHAGIGCIGAIERLGATTRLRLRVVLLLVGRHVALDPVMVSNRAVRLTGRVMTPGLVPAGVAVYHEPPVRSLSVDDLVLKGVKPYLWERIWVSRRRCKIAGTPPAFDWTVPLPSAPAGDYHVVLTLGPPDSADGNDGNPDAADRIPATALTIPVQTPATPAAKDPSPADHIGRVSQSRRGNRAMEAHRRQSERRVPSGGSSRNPETPVSPPTPLHQWDSGNPERKPAGTPGGATPRDPHWRRTTPAFTGLMEIGEMSQLPSGVDPRSGYLGAYMAYADSLEVLVQKTRALQMISAERVQAGAGPVQIGLLATRVANMLAVWMAEDDTLDAADAAGFGADLLYKRGGGFGIVGAATVGWTEAIPPGEEAVNLDIGKIALSPLRPARRDADQAVAADERVTHVGIGCACVLTDSGNRPTWRIRLVELFVSQLARFHDLPETLAPPTVTLHGQFTRKGILATGVEIVREPLPADRQPGDKPVTVARIPGEKLTDRHAPLPKFELEVPLKDPLQQRGIVRLILMVKHYGEGRFPGGELVYIQE